MQVDQSRGPDYEGASAVKTQQNGYLPQQKSHTGSPHRKIHISKNSDRRYLEPT